MNKSLKAGRREEWEHWLERGEREYTKGGKRKRVSYEQICHWVEEVWKTVSGEFIITGFRENGYIGSDDLDRLHSRLRDMISSRKVPDEVIDEVH